MMTSEEKKAMDAGAAMITGIVTMVVVITALPMLALVGAILWIAWLL